MIDSRLPSAEERKTARVVRGGRLSWADGCFLVHQQRTERRELIENLVRGGHDFQRLVYNTFVHIVILLISRDREWLRRRLCDQTQARSFGKLP
jgi:hypothetical protein